jgi:hypothetical protein
MTACAILALSCMMGLLQQVPSNRPPIQTEGRVIDRVQFEGLQNVDAAYLQTVVRVAPGAVWNREEIAAAAARLTETGKFEGNPYAEPREENGKLILVFVLSIYMLIHGERIGTLMRGIMPPGNGTRDDDSFVETSRRSFKLKDFPTLRTGHAELAECPSNWQW